MRKIGWALQKLRFFYGGLKMSGDRHFLLFLTLKNNTLGAHELPTRKLDVSEIGLALSEKNDFSVLTLVSSVSSKLCPFKNVA
jgi:hypothetical protein